MSESTVAGMVDHAWRYFETHSEQRMALFNYFVALLGAALAGIGYTLSSPTLAPATCVLGILLVFLFHVFWQLDRRVSVFLKLAEDALADLEAQFPVYSSRLVARERHRTDTLQRSRCELNPLYSMTYGAAFRSVFRVAGWLGLCVLVLGALSWIGVVRFGAA